MIARLLFAILAVGIISYPSNFSLAQSARLIKPHQVGCKTIEQLNRYYQFLIDRDDQAVLKMMPDLECAPIPANAEVFIMDANPEAISWIKPDGKKSVRMDAVKIRLRGMTQGFWVSEPAIVPEAK